MAIPAALVFPPGVQRDGTRFDSDCAVDSQHTRWRLGRPRKMLGRQLLSDELAGPARRIHMFYQGSRTIVHVGTSASLQQIILDRNGNVLGTANRTPASFAGGASPGWTLDALFDTTSTVVQLVAHSTTDTNLLADANKTSPFIGQIDSPVPLAPFAVPPTTEGGIYSPPLISGGVVCVQPYVFDFDSDGFIGWSAPNLPNMLGVTLGSSGAGQARASAQKIVAGRPLRGGGSNSPAALFWSLSEVIVASFIGGAPVFAFTTVSPESSILSGASVIEYDGLYFWAGVDRFLVYNGTVVEVPNKYNQDWFFDNINRDYAGKSFAFKVPRFGEIWFCAPLFGATEPSHAVIYNIRENCWYDTVLPNGGRGAGFFAQGFPYPIMGGVTPGYSLWLHEKGLDEITGSAPPKPIRAYYETPFFGGIRADPPTDPAVSMGSLEADIAQTGDMVVSMMGGANPRARDSVVGVARLPAIPATAGEQMIGFKAALRLGRLRFESNTLGGNFITGRSILHVDKGDSKQTGGLGNPLTNPPEVTAEDADAPLTDSSVPLSEFKP